ncbi:hypothetical protein PAPYR_11881 [Paratrimastix pyriformis]|uniref:Uncharacterized protein n=1 Tax=Paratrimastix pyriformis TaxID=342808 RepID=A0ABQ8U2Y7_9EUKA|nr:hypothetical protein PAPYR_11881 [Paratrimastix pyriformis]
MTTPDRGVIAVADLACGNPGPMVGAPWARIGAKNAFCPESTPGKFLRGCTPGTRMTLHHHPDRVATSDFENSNFEFGLAETPAPWWGPLGAYRGSIPAGYGTGNSRTRKFLRGCTPGTRMTLHHHPDRVATSDFENSNFEFGLAETPAPWWGPLGAYRGSIPAGYGTGNSRTRKFLRGCTPGTRMTLHHHPDRVATSDFENSNFEFGLAETPAPWWGPLGAYRGSIPAGYGTGNSRTRKFLRGCTPGTRMTLHHHPDRVATSDFENSNFEFGLAETPAPWWGPLGAYRGSIPAGYGTGNSRTRKFLRGCTPGTRMTLHHHPDRVATSDFENSNFEFGVWSTASITTCGNPAPWWGPLGVSGFARCGPNSRVPLASADPAVALPAVALVADAARWRRSALDARRLLETVTRAASTSVSLGPWPSCDMLGMTAARAPRNTARREGPERAPFLLGSG